MKTSELLRDIELGSDVAESDEHLRSYFVETNIFREVIHDETDLILGPKGAGKTAIFRMLSDPRFEVPAIADAIVVPAFNVQGSVLFHDLSETSHADDGALRKLWTAYILALVGSHLVSTFPESPSKSALALVLNRNGLLSDDGSTRSVWKKILAPFKRIMDASVIEGRIEIAGAGSLGGRIESPVPATVVEPPPWMSAEFDSDAVTQTIIELLSSALSRCWVIFDRLDEAFENPTEERAALRGLMRAQADLSSYNATLRVKLFLRSDVMDRVTRGAGFVNTTHFRTLQIAWSRQQIKDLVVTRLSESEEFLRFLDSRRIDQKDAAIRALFSSVAEGSDRTVRNPAFTYMVERTLDATAEHNPRNIVSFLREARNFELVRCERVDPDLGPMAPITQDSMVRAWRRVSERRLVDTLYAEFNAIRPAVEKFRNGPQRFDREYIAKALGLASKSRELDDLIAQLQYCGFMSPQGRQLYRVGDLYRPALGLNPKWQDRT